MPAHISYFCLTPCEQKIYDLYIDALRRNSNFLYKVSAVTITPKGKQVTKEEVLGFVYRQLPLCKNVLELVFIQETSMSGMNHVHGIMITDRISKYTKCPNLVIRTKPLTNPQGWIKYISKDKPKYIHSLSNPDLVAYIHPNLYL